MARIVRFHALGGPEVLRLEDADVGKPGPGELRLKMEIAGLNRAEMMFRQGKYMEQPKLPSRIGFEGSGIVEAVGEGVQGFKTGDRVSVLPRLSPSHYGIWGESAIVEAAGVFPTPPGLSALEAGAAMMQYTSAFPLIEFGKMGIGDYVIIPAASSSVGIAAIQFANWTGAVPIAATRRRDKAAALKAIGAQHVIATEESDLVAEVMRITSGKGARLVFDPVGGHYVETLAHAMAEEGHLFIYGGLSGQPTQFPHWPAALKGLSVRSFTAHLIWNKPERFARACDLITRGLRGGQLKLVIAKQFKLNEIVEANRYLESNQQVGKVVVTL